MKTIRAFSAMAVVAAGIGLSGCAVQRVNDAMGAADNTASEASHYLKQMSSQRSAPKRATSVVHEGQWVSTKPIEDEAYQSAPELDCPITFNPMSDVSLATITRVIASQCGLNIRVSKDALVKLAGNSTSGNQGGTGSTRTADDVLRNAMAGGGAEQASTSSGVASQDSTYLSDISWENKPVRGLLDLITSQLGLSWRYIEEQRSVSISYVDTRSFRLYAIPTTTSLKSLVQSGTSTSTGTGSSTSGGSGEDSGISGSAGSAQETTVALKTNIVEDIKTSIEAMLTDDVGKMAFSATTGNLTVTDTPVVLDRIKRYIDSENKVLTKQILLNVKVLSVSLNDSDEMGINWNLIYRNISDEVGVDLANTVTDGSTNAISTTLSVLDGSSKFSGSDLLVRALSTQGKVSVVTSSSVATLNLKPVPVQVAKQTGYLARTETTITADVGTTTSLTPGTVTSGFNMDLLPYVMVGDDLLLQYSINISSDPTFRTASSGTSRIEIPEMNNRIFSQQAKLHSNETLVLSGFEQASNSGNKSGLGSASNFLFGGGASRDNSRQILVILITPAVLD